MMPRSVGWVLLIALLVGFSLYAGEAAACKVLVVMSYHADTF